ncbi:MAG: hypothetical protein GY859_24845, partial [Desulfobacterales bacterium]|nr:hypothetical protein [Desulfobacterales bacterium]
DDVGGKACETIYVEEFNILKSANQGWRAICFFSKVWMALSLVALLIFVFKGP